MNITNKLKKLNPNMLLEEFLYSNVGILYDKNLDTPEMLNALIRMAIPDETWNHSGFHKYYYVWYDVGFRCISTNNEKEKQVFRWVPVKDFFIPNEDAIKLWKSMTNKKTL